MTAGRLDGYDVYMKKAKSKRDTLYVVKTTVRIPEPIWMRSRTYCLRQRIDLQDLVAEALSSYLKAKGA